MEDRGLKINRKKTVYLRFNVDGNLDGNSDINLQGQNLERANTFKYPGATLAENGDLDAEMMHRITRMEKLEKGIGDSVQPKNKFDSQGESIQDSCRPLRPAMMHGAETWAVEKAQEKSWMWQK